MKKAFLYVGDININVLKYTLYNPENKVPPRLWTCSQTPENRNLFNINNTSSWLITMSTRLTQTSIVY